MDINDLKTSLQNLYDDHKNIGVTVYAALRGENSSPPVKLDIEGSALVGLKELFLNGLKEIISSNDELALLKLSSADERTNAIYTYDLEIPEELTSLETVLTNDDLPLLSLKDNSLSSIKALLIQIGNNAHQIVLYKTLAPVNIFGRKQFFLKKTASRLKKLDEELLRINASFQMLRVNNALLIVDIKSLEKNFGFHEIIKKEARSGVAAIKKANLISNPETLSELTDDITFARKLTKVAKASPVLENNLSGKHIVDFCKNHPTLAKKFKFNESQEQIFLDTKVSKNLFIKLLMDNFLVSELTEFYYESIAKDSLESTVSEDTSSESSK